MTWRRRARILAVTTLMAAASAQSTPYVTIPGSQVSPGNSIWGPSAAAAGDVIHAAWSRGSTYQYSRSIDRGRSWLPVPVSFPTSNPTSLGVGLWASAQNVYLFYADATALRGCSSSIDGGITWRPSVPVVAGNAALVGLVANGGSIHALLWVSSPIQLAYTRSTDGGLTWLATPVILGTSFGYAAPQLTMVGNTLHVAWTSQAGIQYARSIDAGVTWQPVQTLAPVVNYTAQVTLVATSATVVAACVPAQNAVISAIRSVDAGVTWLSPVMLGTASGTAGAADGNGICFAWMAGTAPATVLMAHSVDAGQSWQASTQQTWLLTAATGVRSLVYHHNTIALALECVDYFLPAWIAYPGTVFISKDQGATWLESQQVGDLLHGVRLPALLPLGDSLALVWGLGPNGYTIDQVQASLLFGYQPYGTSKPGTGNVAPRLDGNGEPHTGSTVGIAMSNARGGSLALIAATFAGPASVPFGNGTLLVQPPTINVVGVTSGAQGMPGAGTLAFQIAIPLGGSFRNQRLDFQGFVLDPVAADGFAATGGLELWTF